nr:FAD-binding protein [Mesorhizobium sp.]
MQFHPTALDSARRPMPLVSDAVRGEGAFLVDEQGHRFLADMPRVEEHAVPGCKLGAKRLPRRQVRQALPAIETACRQVGIDSAVEPIPVRPAAH